MIPPFKGTWTDYKKIVIEHGWGLAISRSHLSKHDGVVHINTYVVITLTGKLLGPQA